MNQLILWNIALTITKFYIALDKQNNLNDWIEINDNHDLYMEILSHIKFVMAVRVFVFFSYKASSNSAFSFPAKL